MNEAQKYLLDNNLNDVIISRPNITEPKDWVYVSDTMMSFKNECPHCEGGRVSFDTYDKYLECWVTNSKMCDSCEGSGVKQ